VLFKMLSISVCSGGGEYLLALMAESVAAIVGKSAPRAHRHACLQVAPPELCNLFRVCGRVVSGALSALTGSAWIPRPAISRAARSTSGSV
jgi:hypothetical protein